MDKTKVRWLFLIAFKTQFDLIHPFILFYADDLRPFVYIIPSPETIRCIFPSVVDVVVAAFESEIFDFFLEKYLQSAWHVMVNAHDRLESTCKNRGCAYTYAIVTQNTQCLGGSDICVLEALPTATTSATVTYRQGKELKRSRLHASPSLSRIRHSFLVKLALRSCLSCLKLAVLSLFELVQLSDSRAPVPSEVLAPFE